MRGKGVNSDNKKASMYAKRAMEKGNARAKFFYARLLAIDKKFNEAKKYLDEIIENEKKLEIKLLAIDFLIEYYFCAEKYGGKRDVEKAFLYAQKYDSLVKSPVYYYNKLLYIEAFNKHNANDEFNSYKYFKLAADNGDRDSQYIMGIIEKDSEKSMEYNYKAAKQGDMRSYHMAGNYACTFKKDFKEGMDFYKKAIDKSESLTQKLEAMCEIGIMYRLGEGVPANYETAMSWYQKAVDYYHPRALRELGVKYMILAKSAKNIKDKVENRDKGILLLQMASLFNDKRALEVIKSLQKDQMLFMPLSYSSDAICANGIELYLKDEQKQDIYQIKRASEMGNKHAKNIYALILLSKGETKKAIDLLVENYKAGDFYANFYLILENFDFPEKEECYKAYIEKTNDPDMIYRLAFHYIKNKKVELGEDLLRKNAKENSHIRSKALLINRIAPKCDIMKYVKDVLLSGSPFGANAAYNFNETIFLAKGYPEEFLFKATQVKILQRAILGGEYYDSLFSLGEYYAMHNIMPIEFAEQFILTGIEKYNGDIFGYYLLYIFWGEKDKNKAMAYLKKGAELGDRVCKDALKQLQDNQNSQKN